MRKPINSPAEIVAKGEELAGLAGSEVTPWQIHKALGGRGKLARVEEIWAEHLSAQSSTKPQRDVVLPEEAEGIIDEGLAELRGHLQNMLAGVISNMMDKQRLQISLMSRDHERELSAQREEIEYLRAHVDELEEQINHLEHAVAHERVGAEGTSPSRVPQDRSLSLLDLPAMPTPVSEPTQSLAS